MKNKIIYLLTTAFFFGNFHVLNAGIGFSKDTRENDSFNYDPVLEELSPYYKDGIMDYDFFKKKLDESIENGEIDNILAILYSYDRHCVYSPESLHPEVVEINLRNLCLIKRDLFWIFCSASDNFDYNIKKYFSEADDQTIGYILHKSFYVTFILGRFMNHEKLLKILDSKINIDGKEVNVYFQPDLVDLLSDYARFSKGDITKFEESVNNDNGLCSAWEYYNPLATYDLMSFFLGGKDKVLKFLIEREYHIPLENFLEDEE